jgi:hypothetical protein
MKQDEAGSVELLSKKNLRRLCSCCDDRLRASTVHDRRDDLGLGPGQKNCAAARTMPAIIANMDENSRAPPICSETQS